MKTDFNVSVFLKQLLKFCFLRVLTMHLRHKHAGVLLIKNNHLGDLIISLDLMKQAAEIVHAKKQRMVVATSSAGVNIFEKCSFIDEVIECDYSCLTSGFFNRVKALRQLTLFRADKIVQMVIDAMSSVIDREKYLSGNGE